MRGRAQPSAGGLCGSAGSGKPETVWPLTHCRHRSGSPLTWRPTSRIVPVASSDAFEDHLAHCGGTLRREPREHEGALPSAFQDRR